MIMTTTQCPDCPTDAKLLLLFDVESNSYTCSEGHKFENLPEDRPATAPAFAPALEDYQAAAQRNDELNRAEIGYPKVVPVAHPVNEGVGSGETDGPVTVTAVYPVTEVPILDSEAVETASLAAPEKADLAEYFTPSYATVPSAQAQHEAAKPPTDAIRRESNGDIKVTISIPECETQYFIAEAEVQGVSVEDFVNRKFMDALECGWLK